MKKYVYVFASSISSSLEKEIREDAGPQYENESPRGLWLRKRLVFLKDVLEIRDLKRSEQEEFLDKHIYLNFLGNANAFVVPDWIEIDRITTFEINFAADRGIRVLVLSHRGKKSLEKNLSSLWRFEKIDWKEMFNELVDVRTSK